MHRVGVLFLLGVVLLFVGLEGASARVGDSCSPRRGCDPGEFCDLRGGNAACFRRPGTTLTGICERSGQSHRCVPKIQRVCGCNGVTYTNDCMRIQVGVLKRHNGRC